MRMPGWISQNFWLKVLSFAIALVLWVFVRVEEKAELVMRIPIRFTNLPAELVIVGDSVPDVQVVVEGPRTLVSQVERTVTPYTINLDGARAGSQQVRILPERISLARGVEVVRIVPSVVEVTLERVEEYRVQVQARLQGNVAPGFEIVTADVEPAQIEIATAAGELDGQDSVRTEPISIQDKKSDWSGIVPLDLSGLNVKSITTREVEVFVKISPKMITRELTGVPIDVRGPGGPYKTQPATVTVRVMGPENLVKTVNVGQLRGAINLNQRVAVRTQMSYRVEGFPDQVVLLNMTPEQVQVRPQP